MKFLKLFLFTLLPILGFAQKNQPAFIEQIGSIVKTTIVTRNDANTATIFTTCRYIGNTNIAMQEYIDAATGFVDFTITNLLNKDVVATKSTNPNSQFFNVSWFGSTASTVATIRASGIAFLQSLAASGATLAPNAATETTLATIATNSATQATAANQTTGNTSLATIATNSATQATAANQATGNASLATIANNSATQATATNQATGNTSLASIDTKLTNNATTTKQDVGNASLATIATNSATQANLANQNTTNTLLTSVTTNQNTSNSLLTTIAVVPTTGVNLTTSTDYTTAANVLAVGTALRIIIENVGTANATFIYAGATYNIGNLGNANGFPTQRRFEIILDPLSKKISPIANLTINGSATGIIRVTLIPKQ